MLSPEMQCGVSGAVCLQVGGYAKTWGIGKVTLEADDLGDVTLHSAKLTRVFAPACIAPINFSFTFTQLSHEAVRNCW